MEILNPVIKQDFKTDEDVIRFALLNFKDESRFLIQEVEEAQDGSLVFGNVREFEDRSALRLWISHAQEPPCTYQSFMTTIQFKSATEASRYHLQKC